MVYICYLITNGSRTYVGITNNFGRRLRQHNGEISGGARSTSRRAIEGQPWRLAACVRNIAEHNDALSYEKCVHLASRPGRRRSKSQVCGVENRMRIMQTILAKYKRGEYVNKTTGQVRDASAWEFTLVDPSADQTTAAAGSGTHCSPDPAAASPLPTFPRDADDLVESHAYFASPVRRSPETLQGPLEDDTNAPLALSASHCGQESTAHP